MKMYSIIDLKAKSIVSVFTSLNDETAKRSFLMLLTGAESIFTEFPEDFAIYPLCDIVVDGSIVILYEPNTENLRANGFGGKSLSVACPISCGLDFDKRYLRMIREDRAKIDEIVSDEEVSE